MISRNTWLVLSLVGAGILICNTRGRSSPCYVETTFSCEQLLEDHAEECGSCGEWEYQETGYCESNHLITIETEGTHPSHRIADENESGQTETGVHEEYPIINCGKIVSCSCDLSYDCDESECYEVYSCNPKPNDVVAPLDLWATYISGDNCSN